MDEFPDVTCIAATYGASSALSTRMAWNLWATARSLADVYADEATWDLLEAELPPLAQRLTDRAWMARFVRCFDAIAARLGKGKPDLRQLASCTGEEMALHLVIDQAETWSNQGMLATPESLASDADDEDFDWARDVLFRDHDVLLLFDASLDGLEDPESELHERFRFANLHPNRWFVPFADHADDD